jgi:hypothetical protein
MWMEVSGFEACPMEAKVLEMFRFWILLQER